MKPLFLASALACLLTLVVYAACARLGTAVYGNDAPEEAVYNRLSDGFAAGQLSLRREVPAGFARLADPYDPAQNEPYRNPPYLLYDLSYFQGRLYAYFGPLPALLLFWPYHLLTGAYLSYKAAGVFLAGAGFLAAAWLLLDARRRYAPRMPAGWAAAMLAGAGLTAAVPTLLARLDVWEIPVAAGAALVLLFLAALWQAWHRPDRAPACLAGASLALGFAVASRPTTLLLAPLLGALAWSAPAAPRRGRRLLAALLPLALCLGALAAYNHARFGAFAEFGQRYQLAAGEYEGRLRHFSPRYVGDNLRIYFLHPAPWQAAFPFVGDPAPLAVGPGHSAPEFNFGILLNVPLAWFALAGVRAAARRDGLGFLARALLFVAAAQIGLLLCFFGTVSRYQVEILLPLILLAAVGLLAHEAAPRPRGLFRGAWLALALFSVAFNLAHAARHALKTRAAALGYAVTHDQLPAALGHLDALLFLQPRNPAFHNERGVALASTGRLAEGEAEFAAAVRLDPQAGYAHRNLGRALLQAGDRPGAIRELEASLRLEPGNAIGRSALAQARAAEAAPGPAR